MVDVHFCGNCGTKLFLTFERFPDVIGAYGGTFDDPNWFARSAENAKHIFVGVAQHGAVIPAGISWFEKHATTNQGSPIEPRVFEEHHVIESD